MESAVTVGSSISCFAQEWCLNDKIHHLKYQLHIKREITIDVDLLNEGHALTRSPLFPNESQLTTKLASLQRKKAKKIQDLEKVLDDCCQSIKVKIAKSGGKRRRVSSQEPPKSRPRVQAPDPFNPRIHDPREDEADT